MAASKYALIMQMELVWPAGLVTGLAGTVDSGFWSLAMGMAALTGALISSDFTFFPAALRCVLSLSLCLIHDPFFAAKQIVNV